MKFTALMCLFFMMVSSVSPLFQGTDAAFANDEDRGALDVVVDILVTVGSVGGIAGGLVALVSSDVVESVPVVGQVPAAVLQGIGVMGICGGAAGILTSGYNLVNDVFGGDDPDPDGDDGVDSFYCPACEVWSDNYPCPNH